MPIYHKSLYCFTSLLIISGFWVTINANQISSNVILVGLKNAHLGCELSYRKFDIRLTGALSSVSGSYWSVDGDIKLGLVLKKSNDMEWIFSAGSYFKYTRTLYNNETTQKAISLIPNINCSINKYFKNFLVGGNLKLDTWQGRKSLLKNSNSGWHSERLFNINPEFVIGYRFL